MGKRMSRLSCVKAERELKKKRKGTKGTISKARRTATARKARKLDFSAKCSSSASSAAAAVKSEAHERNDSEESQVIIMPTRELWKLETIVEGEENSSANKCGRVEGLTMKQAELVPDTSKKIGNSIELLACPDISTIMALSDRRGATSSCALTSKLPLPAFITTGDDFMPATPLTDEQLSAVETSNSTLMVPPNSLNSQFISGITPMDSLQDISADGASDSVFAHDLSYIPEHCLDAVYFANFGAGRVFLNNNSLVASPECVAAKTGENAVKGGNSVEVSSGPGLDSDFGASAGIEMRIVSSDFSGANNNESQHATDRERLSVPEYSFKTRGSETKRMHSTARVMQRALSVPAETTESYRQLYGLLVRHPSRLPSSIGCPENVFRSSLDWDPYDTYYRVDQWREYFIPGVSYPARPLLRPEEHWL